MTIDGDLIKKDEGVAVREDGECERGVSGVVMQEVGLGVHGEDRRSR